MSISMDEAVNQMKLATLADLSTDELQRHRCKQPFDDRYSVEILRRALVEQTDEAWSVLQQCFSETIRGWIHSHPSSDVALLRDSEENYLAQTFSRFWYAVRDQQLEFTSLYAALSYLHATLNGIIIDTLRSHLRLRSREVPFPEPGCTEEPRARDPIDSPSVWNSMQSLLRDERERRLAYLLYYCGLKPREIVLRCPKEFDDVKDIYRLNHNIVERLRRNRESISSSGSLLFLFQRRSCWNISGLLGQHKLWLRRWMRKMLCVVFLGDGKQSLSLSTRMACLLKCISPVILEVDGKSVSFQSEIITYMKEVGFTGKLVGQLGNTASLKVFLKKQAAIEVRLFQ